METSKKYRILAVLIPAVIHGTYDFVVIFGNRGPNAHAFEVLFIVAYLISGVVVAYNIMKNDNPIKE